ncbi:hypothetical protein Save01_05550 [Streptomyces avermitilis]
MRTNLCRQAPYRAPCEALRKAPYKSLCMAPYVMSVTVCEEDPTA